MKKLSCVIFNSNKDILLIKQGEEYFLPSFNCADNEPEKTYLSNVLKKEFGLKTKPEFFIYKLTNENEAYYYCEEPCNPSEFKKIKDDMVWTNEKVLKDILKKTNNSKKLIEVLSNILGTNFSYSKSERVKNEEGFNNADSDLLKEFFLIRNMSSILGNNLSELDQEYRKKFIERFCLDINLLKQLKYNEYINDLDSVSIGKLTLHEARLIGKEEEWNIEFKKAIDLSKLLPSVPEHKLDYFEEELKLQNKDSYTPHILISLFKRYHGKSYEEIRKDVLKRRNEQKKNKKK